MIKCPRCGATHEDGAYRCGECGKDLVDVDGDGADEGSAPFPIADGGTHCVDDTERNQERLNKGVPIEPTGEDCPHCPDGELVKPRSELEQCPDCLFVNNPMHMGNELQDFNLTHRQGRLLLRTFGYDFHGSTGDIATRLRRFCSENELDREELNKLLADLRGYDTGGDRNE